MNERKLTIRDIARLAGVSRSTVSLVINNDRRISEETRKKVLSVIQNSSYEPNAMARGLARRRAGMIAVVVPVTSNHTFSDYYFSEAISGISDALTSRGYRMLIEIATDQFVAEGNHHKLFREGLIDGMLLVGTLTTDAYIREIGRLYRVLLVNSCLEGLPSVHADNYVGARQMVDHLVSLGHRRIGFIGGLETTTVGFDRARGYRDGVAAAGLPATDKWFAWGNFSEASGYEAGLRLMAARPRPTAIFASNDMMAIGCLRAAGEVGLKVPEDVTVVGADDVGLASYVRPRLTTIRQPMYEIGQAATEALLDLGPVRAVRAATEAQNGRPGEAPECPQGASARPGEASERPSATPPRRVFATTLVIRESSAPPSD